METGDRACRRLAVAVAALLVSCGEGGARASTTAATIVVDASVPVPSTTEPVPDPTTADSRSVTTMKTTPQDRADAYLGETTEIYRRALPDGHDFVVRLSTEPYARVFGLTWDAPTGSALCLGDRALFFGVPGDIGSWGSAWVAAPWFDRSSPSQSAVVQSSMSAAAETIPATRYIVVRTGLDARQVVLASRTGVEFDRASVVDGVAMVVVGPEALSGGRAESDLRLTVVADSSGLSSPPSPLVSAAGDVSADCGPGDAPPRPLPERGVQPDDAATAQARIRERYALLVDRSTPAEQKPADLLDDNTGVQDAIAGVDTGQFADEAATATYSIDELVFTKPDEAWFRYSIATTTAIYSDRVGIATFNGEVWQITRATICQDLALALSPCQPTPQRVEPPSTPEWEAAWQEWIGRANLYVGNDGCGPLSQC